MMPNSSSKVKEFLRAGTQRFNAAKALFTGSIRLEAIYLAGYTIECALKAVIIHNIPKKELQGVLDRITRGSKAHNYESLLHELRLCRVNMPDPFVDHMRIALKLWTPDLRYQSGLKPVQEVEAMFEATQLILAWAERSTL